VAGEVSRGTFCKHFEQRGTLVRELTQQLPTN